MIKKYYVDWSVEGIVSNWGKVLGRCYPQVTKSENKTRLWRGVELLEGLGGGGSCASCGFPAM